MTQNIHDQAVKIDNLEKENQEMKKENQEMKKQIQEILARLNG